MAICRPEAIDDAPARGPEQSGGWRRRDFLASRGMGEAQGKKVSPPPLRLRRSRRSRPLARSAKERPWVRAEQHPQEKTWLTRKVLHKRSDVLIEEKEAMA